MNCPFRGDTRPFRKGRSSGLAWARAAGDPKSQNQTKGTQVTDVQTDLSNRARLVATARELQTMADLIGKYPAEAQLIMAAIEDGLTLGPMRVMDTDERACDAARPR